MRKSKALHLYRPYDGTSSLGVSQVYLLMWNLECGIVSGKTFSKLHLLLSYLESSIEHGFKRKLTLNYFEKLSKALKTHLEFFFQMLL